MNDGKRLRLSNVNGPLFKSLDGVLCSSDVGRMVTGNLTHYFKEAILVIAETSVLSAGLCFCARRKIKQWSINGFIVVRVALLV